MTVTNDHEKNIPAAVSNDGSDRVSSTTETGGDRVVWPDREAWLGAPAGLAWVVGDTVQMVNDAASRLLQESVGKDGSVWRMWLVAAVRRLENAQRNREIVTASRARNRSLEITCGEQLPGQAGRIVAIRDASADLIGDNEKSETIAMLSHELRTPLTSIKNSVGMVLGGETGEMTTHQERFLNMTMRNIERLERLVNDLLDTSRAEAGKLEMHRTQVDLGPLLRDTLEVFAISGKEKNITIDYTNLPDSFPAFVDGDKVVQIIHNIVGNSLKFTEKDGFVRVWLKGRRDRLDPLAELLVDEYSVPVRTFTLVVEDSGTGMSPETLAQVFEPYERGVRAEKQHVPGSGLGLHITQGLVEAQGGDIELQSVPDLGTTVSIVLPRDPQTEQVLLATRKLAAELGMEAKGVDPVGPADPANPTDGFDDVDPANEGDEATSVSLVALDIRRADGTPPAGDLIAAGAAARKFVHGLEDGDQVLSDPGAMTGCPATPGNPGDGVICEQIRPGFWLAVVSDTTRLDEAWEVQRVTGDVPPPLADSQWEIVSLHSAAEPEPVMQ